MLHFFWKQKTIGGLTNQTINKNCSYNETAVKNQFAIARLPISPYVLTEASFIDKKNYFNFNRINVTIKIITVHTHKSYFMLIP